MEESGAAGDQPENSDKKEEQRRQQAAEVGESDRKEGERDRDIVETTGGDGETNNSLVRERQKTVASLEVNTKSLGEQGANDTDGESVEESATKRLKTGNIDSPSRAKKLNKMDGFPTSSKESSVSLIPTFSVFSLNFQLSIFIEFSVDWHLTISFFIEDGTQSTFEESEGEVSQGDDGALSRGHIDQGRFQCAESTSTKEIRETDQVGR